ncbi:hypothetical protein EES42_39165 [Streptomyces sp. ADI95-17]|nr:hypothetical protein EES42_39165 [Streptomyces sp. ADI95-17]
MTVAAGPLSAAIETPATSNGRTSSSDAWSETIAPPSGRACIRRPRAATSVAASWRERTPATWAAASSPMEWPASRSGSIPQWPRSRDSATSTANRAAWVWAVRCSRPASSLASSAYRTSRSGRSRCGSRCAQTSSNASRNSGKRAASSRPVPSRWLPCPLNRNASLPSVTVPRTGPASSATRASRPRSSSSRSAPTTTARSSKAVRVVASEWATSTGSYSGCAASRARSLAAWPASAASPRADITQGTRPGRTAVSGCTSAVSGRASAVSGRTSASVCPACSSACSRMTWALVPLMPNDETPTRRGSPVSGQSVRSVRSRT